jgi:integrase/recombinase XerC
MMARLEREKLLDRFRGWLVQSRYSPFTVRNYSGEVARFGRWLAPRPLQKASPALVRSYVLGGAERGELPGTTNLRVASLRNFYQWSCRTFGRPPADPTARLRLRASAGHSADFLSEHDIAAVVAAIGDQARDRAVFLLFLSCGLRLGELVELDRCDVLLTGETPRLAAHGRQLPLLAEAAEAVGRYLAARRDSEAALFLTRQGRRLAARTIQGSFAAHFARARVGGSIRTLRHSCAVRWARSGLGLHELQQLMGNRSLQSAEPYRAFAPARLRAGEPEAGQSRPSAKREGLSADSEFQRPAVSPGPETIH